MTLSIGQVAKAAEVKIPTIRFYEEIGLLPAPRRAANDRRIYEPAIVERLAFVRHARQGGSRWRRCAPCWTFRTIRTDRAATPIAWPPSSCRRWRPRSRAWKGCGPSWRAWSRRAAKARPPTAG